MTAASSQLRTIDRKIASARSDIRERDKLEKDLEEARSTLLKLREKRGHLEARLSQEADDVRKLEGLSLTNLFQTVLGDKENAMRRERQQLLTAQLSRDQCASEIAFLEGEVDELQSRFSAIGNPVERFRAALTEKQEFLRTTNNPQAEEVLGLAAMLADLRSNEKELNEAIAAGDAARRSLSDALDTLGSAMNWGVFDMVGGGLVASYVKHQRIDKVRELIDEGQQRLRRFEQEVKDVAPLCDSAIGKPLDFGDLGRFADVLFDNMVIDWMVQSKLRETKSSVTAALKKLEQKLKELTEDRRKNHDQLSVIEGRHQLLIETL